MPFSKEEFMPNAKKLVLLTVALALTLSLSLLAMGDYREEFSKTLPLKAGDSFSLDNINGSLTVATWKENKVEIKAVKVAKDDAKDLKDVEIKVEESAGAVTVHTIWPRDRHNFRVSVTFDVKVPEGVNLKKVETVNGNVTAIGSFGAAALESTNGTITAEGFKGNLTAETTNGQVKLRRAEGKLDVEATNGNIELSGIVFKDGLRAETTNGSIRLVLENPEKVNARLRAETTNGHVTVDFPITLERLSKSNRSIEATLGQGGPEIVLSTTNGSITITK
jgi:DUF4097 and DUF4098 domain-containing protein YvlB